MVEANNDFEENMGVGYSFNDSFDGRNSLNLDQSLSGQKISSMMSSSINNSSNIVNQDAE